MAHTKLPDPLQRRHWLEQDLDPGRAVQIADAYLAQSRVMEAVGFLARAGDRDRLASLREDAIAAGDLFLLRELSERLGEEPEAEDYRRLIDAARAAGKERYASEAERQLTAREG